MLSVVPINDHPQIQRLTRHAIEQNALTRRDHLWLTSAILGDPTLSPLDRTQINHVLDLIRMGRVRLVN
ncbi:hypothetical protein [Pseudanabaena sp. FACHB-2040]|uniref:hypothetical protein n=1 Tax=Pseudanabaena sp. FACHB-2040 TaxID=2692859 RepID=UPI0016844F7B|nr:hypothetical protein [Pseudanabaena sp. FACHB-2040]MBD0267253.1 hypothetical protein [Cyanobacteria bacterium Co-bin8]MBD2258895.1 hypothetical protein [Pseudanabaena sp. FACHB-2040]